MKTYAQYKYPQFLMGQALGSAWYEVQDEWSQYYPSGLHHTIKINGKAVKAKDCIIVQVFEKVVK